MIRVQRNSDGALGYAWQRTPPTTLRELLVDRLIPVGCSVGDYIVALDKGGWDAVTEADYPKAYAVVQASPTDLTAADIIDGGKNGP